MTGESPSTTSEPRVRLRKRRTVWYSPRRSGVGCRMVAMPEPASNLRLWDEVGMHGVRMGVRMGVLPPATRGCPPVHSPELRAPSHQPEGDEVGAAAPALPVVEEHPCREAAGQPGRMARGPQNTPGRGERRGPRGGCSPEYRMRAKGRREMERRTDRRRRREKG